MKTRRRAGRRSGASSALRGRLGPLLPVLLLVVAGAGGCVRPLAPARLSEELRSERHGYLGWTASGWGSTSKVPWDRCDGTVVGLGLRTPEGGKVNVRCCRTDWPRVVELQGEQWTVPGRDYDCTLRQGDTEVGTLVVRWRDDRRIVGLLQTDGVAVRAGACERVRLSDGTPGWNVMPAGHAIAWELTVDDRLVGVVGQGLLYVDPGLTPEQRRSVGLADTILPLHRLRAPLGAAGWGSRRAA